MCILVGLDEFFSFSDVAVWVGPQGIQTLEQVLSAAQRSSVYPPPPPPGPIPEHLRVPQHVPKPGAATDTTLLAQDPPAAPLTITEAPAAAVPAAARYTTPAEAAAPARAAVPMSLDADAPWYPPPGAGITVWSPPAADRPAATPPPPVRRKVTPQGRLWRDLPPPTPV